jgi:hypothetical protein
MGALKQYAESEDAGFHGLGKKRNGERRIGRSAVAVDLGTSASRARLESDDLEDRFDFRTNVFRQAANRDQKPNTSAMVRRSVGLWIIAFFSPWE